MRKLNKLMLGLVFVLTAMPILVLAQTTTSTTGDITNAQQAIGAIQAMIAAFHSHSYALASGLFLSLLVAAARYFNLLNWVPDSADKWVAFVLALMASVGLGLRSGQDFVTIIVTAISIAVAAIGGWEVLFQPLRNSLLHRARYDAPHGSR